MNFSAIKVVNSISVSNASFRADVINGLKSAYVAAFTRASSIFSQKLLINPTQSFENIKIMMDSISLTGITNPENTKNVVKLRYYIMDQNNVTFTAVYAADAINLLTKSEMGIYMNQEVNDQGYAEDMPRTYSPDADQKLWIIGAVLGPLALLIFLFWLVAFIYYKCIRPKNNNKQDKAGAKRLKDESPFSVSEI